MHESVVDAVVPGILGQGLQKARRARGLTQQEVADSLELARTTVTALEKGERRIRPASDLLVRLKPGYPDVQPDMWWFSPPVHLADGRELPNTNVLETYLGRTWQRWSRHFNSGQWQSGIEQLVRLGVRHLSLFDPDALSASNLTRVYGSFLEDIGKSKVKVIAAYVGRTRDGLERARQQGKALGPPRKVGPGQLAAMRWMREGGASLRMIASEFECSPSTVMRALRREGVVP